MENKICDLLNYSWEITNKRYDNFTDLGNYIILADEISNINFDEIVSTIKVFGGENPMGCTCAVKIADNGDVLVGRNMDIDIRQYPTFLAPTSFGKYRTLNITYLFNGPWKYKDILKEGKLNEYFTNAVAFGCTDAFNEKGLYIETNMRCKEDCANILSTNPGKKSVPWTMIPSLACANCATVEETIEYVKNSYDYYVYNSKATGMDGWGFSFILADATGKYGLLEMANGEIHFTPYQYGQANYYLNPTLNACEQYGCGHGRLEFINSRLFEPQTKEDMLELMKKISFSKEVLFPKYSYRDDKGKIHFVDDKNNEICDWRSDYNKNVFVDDDNIAHAFSKYQKGHDDYLNALYSGDENGININKEAYEKYEEQLKRATTAWCLDNKNFETLQKAVIEKKAKDVEDLKEYFKGNEDPLRDNGHVWTSALSFGVNCTQKSLTLRMWERENIKITINW